MLLCGDSNIVLLFASMLQVGGVGNLRGRLEGVLLRADGVSRLLVRYKNNQKFSVTGFLAISRRKLGVSCSGIMQLARCEVLRTRKPQCYVV